MTCDVCDTIIDIYSAGFEECDEEILGEVSTVLGSNCPHSESLRRAANFDKPITDFLNELLAIRKEKKQTGVRLGLAHLTPEDEIIFHNVSTTLMDLVLPSSPSLVNHPGQAILPDPKWIDLGTIRRWFSACKSQHQSQCSEPSWLKGVEAAEPEWFIDVVDNCIVSPPAGADYVALSYTWGLGRNLKNTKATLDELRQPSALKVPKFATQLPETIRNTIDTVRSLGERYLWVDALCIIQDDPASLGRNLNQMQLIYANSTFCVVAATGCGAEVGLRGLEGLSPERNLEMRVYDLADGNKLIAKPLFGDPTAGTKYSYSQRGWTFQEWLFSRRRLVFNYGPLEWQCQCARWQETFQINPEVDAQWARMSRTKESALDPSPSIWDFMSMASTFNTKALTMQEDAPKAFAGIQAMLHRVHPGGLLYGLSEFFFDISLAWSSLYSNIQRRRGSNAANALQDGLPSWSWLGWEGDVNFPNDAEFQMIQPWNHHEQKIGFREPVTEWFTMATPTSTSRRRVRSEWHKYKVKLMKDPLASLPDGWTRQEYKQENHPHDFYPRGSEPKEVFSHSLSPQHGFKYPVPVLNWAHTPVLSDQTQYLWCETSQVHLVLSKATVFRVEDYDRRIRFVEGNETILSLTLGNVAAVEEIVSGTIRPDNLELVAFAKGWSTWLGNDVVDDDEAGEGKTRIPGMDTRDCYFVLWIETRGNVSYRLACGEALASWWEENKEEGPSQVILG